MKHWPMHNEAVLMPTWIRASFIESWETEPQFPDSSEYDHIEKQDAATNPNVVT